MSNPVCVEITRGNLVESRHRGSVAVVDGDGKLVLSLGDIERGVFPRSACKAMQALALVESGAADAYGFGNKELALACSSHSGEDAHVALAASMLARASRPPGPVALSSMPATTSVLPLTDPSLLVATMTTVSPTFEPMPRASNAGTVPTWAGAGTPRSRLRCGRAAL